MHTFTDYVLNLLRIRPWVRVLETVIRPRGFYGQQGRLTRKQCVQFSMSDARETEGLGAHTEDP